jgi:hypothetical protein
MVLQGRIAIGRPRICAAAESSSVSYGSDAAAATKISGAVPISSAAGSAWFCASALRW